MLSSASEALLCKLLVKVSQGERSVESLRNILCEDYRFNPYEVFYALDNLRINGLIPKSFLDLLSGTRLDLSEQDLYLVVRQYSSLSNGRLSYNDFLSLVAPSANPALNEIARARRRFFSQELPFPVSFGLKRLLERETELQIELETIKRELYDSEEFSVWKAFKSLDVTGKGLINDSDLIDFAKQHGHFLLLEDLDAILRRISTKNSLNIDYNDFLEFSIPVYSKEYQNEPEEKMNEDELEETSEKELETPVKSMEEPDSRPPVAKVLFPQLPFNELLTKQVFIERTFEFLRQSLAMLHNFSLEQAMEVFASEDKDFIYIADLEDTLSKLGVESTRKDIWSLFYRYGATDEDSPPFLNFQALSVLLLPKDIEYSNKLSVRENQQFTNETFAALKELLNYAIHSERNLESIRNSLSELQEFNVAEIFQAIDSNQDGIVEPQEMKDALMNAGLDLSEKDLHGLLERYSREPAGFSFDQFSTEVEPRLA